MTTNGLGKDIWTLPFKNITDLLHVSVVLNNFFYTMLILAGIPRSTGLVLYRSCSGENLDPLLLSPYLPRNHFQKGRIRYSDLHRSYEHGFRLSDYFPMLSHQLPMETVGWRT